MKKLLSTFLILLFASSVALPSVFAEKRTLIATAYYSPVKGQSYYLRGSYEADIKLNGKGTHGASGQAVYPGMIAAPKSYAFGTKIAIAGIGTGTVSDRGGAIVKAGERGYAYDRIDIWMGSGEQWLARALAWGKRTISAEVIEVQTGALLEVRDRKIDTLQIASLPLSKLPKNMSGALAGSGMLNQEKLRAGSGSILKETAHVWSGILTMSGKLSASGSLIASKTTSASGTIATQKNPVAAGVVDKKTFDTSIFTRTIGESSPKTDIIALSRVFLELGLLEGKPREAYNPDVRMAVASFQLESGIIVDQKDPNLGVFGKITAKRLGERWKELKH